MRKRFCTTPLTLKSKKTSLLKRSAAYHFLLALCCTAYKSAVVPRARKRHRRKSVVVSADTSPAMAERPIHAGATGISRWSRSKWSPTS